MPLKYLKFIIFLLVFISWFILDYQKLKQDNLQIYSSSLNIPGILIKKQANCFNFGGFNENLMRQIKPFYSNSEVINLEDFLILNDLKFHEDFSVISKNNPKISIKKITNNFLSLQVDKTKFFYFKKDFKSNISKYPTLNLNSDFWVLESSKIPANFPPPKTAILLLKNSRIYKKFNNWAEENKIPVLNNKKTGGYFLEKEDLNWKLKIVK